MAIRISNPATPAGAALTLARELHAGGRISIADLRCFEAALIEQADKEATALDDSPERRLARQAMSWL